MEPDAAQFRDPPAELEPDPRPHHPHWDMVFEHIGIELTPALEKLPWADKANIKTGADYLRAWVACAFRDPFEPTALLVPLGQREQRQKHPPRGSGTAGDQGRRQGGQGAQEPQRLQRRVGRRDHLCGGGNQRCRTPGAHDRIKEYVTARTLSIREMRTNVYQVPNTTHWIQTANYQSHCPVFPGDTRITVIEVGDLLPEQEVPKLICWRS